MSQDLIERGDIDELSALAPDYDWRLHADADGALGQRGVEERREGDAVQRGDGE
jgi:ketosteroid isomerase-like protein